MYLQNPVKFFLFFIVLFSSLINYSQADSSHRSQSPYKNEYNPWYKLTVFQRGFDSNSIKKNLDALEAKPRREWTRTDSLSFAESLIRTGRADMAAYYFEHLNPDYSLEEDFWWEEMMSFILNKSFEEGIESIYVSSPGILQYSKIYFLDQILKAYIANKKDSKWYKTHNVLNWPVDSTLLGIDRTNERYQNEVIRPLSNLEFVLKQLIHYIHKDDPIIASACLEMGVIFENHVSLTDAYIAYSIGRHYNKWDKNILNSVKAVKVKLSEKKYKIPIFTRYFPMTEHWRFEYEVLKEKINHKGDTTTIIKPTLMLPKKEDKVPFPPELIVVGGILLLFLLLLFFLKTKK